MSQGFFEWLWPFDGGNQQQASSPTADKSYWKKQTADYKVTHKQRMFAIESQIAETEHLTAVAEMDTEYVTRQGDLIDGQAKLAGAQIKYLAAGERNKGKIKALSSVQTKYSQALQASNRPSLGGWSLW